MNAGEQGIILAGILGIIVGFIIIYFWIAAKKILQKRSAIKKIKLQDKKGMSYHYSSDFDKIVKKEDLPNEQKKETREIEQSARRSESGNREIGEGKRTRFGKAYSTK